MLIILALVQGLRVHGPLGFYSFGILCGSTPTVLVESGL